MARKPSIRVMQNKKTIKIIKTFYDDYGKILKKQVEAIPKFKRVVK